MNLDVPYYRLGNHEKVEYIPLKLALNDDTASEPQQFSEPVHKMPINDMVGYDNTTSNVSAGIIILISVVAFIALFLLLFFTSSGVHRCRSVAKSNTDSNRGAD